MIEWEVEIPVLNVDDWWQKTQEEYTEHWRGDIRPYWEGEVDPVNQRAWAQRKEDYPWKTLRKTGSMQDTAQLEVGSNDLFRVRINRYGIYHQNGTRHMAQRRWLGIPREGVQKLSKFSAKHILNNGRTKTYQFG